MRASITSSAIIHAVVLGWGLLSFSAPSPMDMANSESMPVEIISDVSQLQQGDKTAAKNDKPAPKPSEKPQTVPDAQNIGESDTDTDTKPVPETKPKPVEAAEAPKPSEMPVEKPEPQPDPKPEVQPEPTPVPATEVKPKPEPQQEVKPDPVAEAINETRTATIPTEAPKAEPAPVAEKPAEEQMKLPEKVAMPQAKPTPPAQTAKTPERKEPTEKPKKTQTASTPSKDKGIADEVAALLNNQKPAGGGAKRSTDRASLGSQKPSTGEKLSQSEMDALKGAIQKCWNVPAGAEDADGLLVTVKMRLTRSGEIEGTPEVSGSGSSPVQRAAVESARRAVLRCAPYSLPQEKYDTWADVTVNFDPRDMF
ncbi:hypothetical protein M8997_010690 [Phyllobacterium sp. 21LDTY02-6]|uniref:hypothetical protein n=1 Tax=Phyllobacterium sp. 21LDTY02-6 TaxID=2944903 RepID=UPI0020213574|nr:hypothetical protein [Phyllobacterium sp. 21LDTY02-6]MCO4317652.1 hypothetical protein [Phyllobacterium sp. 21LDTY02-6]